jgi:hypothetical protein
MSGVIPEADAVTKRRIVLKLPDQAAVLIHVTDYDLDWSFLEARFYPRKIDTKKVFISNMWMDCETPADLSPNGVLSITFV